MEFSIIQLVNISCRHYFYSGDELVLILPTHALSIFCIIFCSSVLDVHIRLYIIKYPDAVHKSNHLNIKWTEIGFHKIQRARKRILVIVEMALQTIRHAM